MIQLSHIKIIKKMLALPVLSLRRFSIDSDLWLTFLLGVVQTVQQQKQAISSSGVGNMYQYDYINLWL